MKAGNRMTVCRLTDPRSFAPSAGQRGERTRGEMFMWTMASLEGKLGGLRVDGSDDDREGRDRDDGDPDGPKNLFQGE